MPNDSLKIQGILPLRRVSWDAVFALVGGAFTTILCGFAVGQSLGVVIGGLLASALLVPCLTAGHRLQFRIQIVIGTTAGISSAWLALFGAGATIGEWMALAAILGGECFVLTTVTAVLESSRIHNTLASAIATVVGVSWLTWPIWLSVVMTTPVILKIVPMLVLVHPPLVANGILTFTSPWTEQTLAYNLTLLSQDVPFRLPATALPCIAFEFVLGFAIIVVSQLISKSYNRQLNLPRIPPESPAAQ